MMRRQHGQALVMLLGACLALLASTVLATAVGGAFMGGGRLQRVADTAALAAARGMRADYPRLLVPRYLPDGSPNPRYLSVARYRMRARAIARASIRGLGLSANRLRVGFRPVTIPTEVRIHVASRHGLAKLAGDRRNAGIALRAAAGAELVFGLSGTWDAMPTEVSESGYSGTVAYRQGRPMRPDVAVAFDSMATAASSAGLHLVINSALRSDAEQRRLWALRPDPKWVAPPGTSLHRYGTELDLGPSSAYRWLAVNARRFGFIKRYAWEPWHFGYGRNPRDVPARYEQGSWEPPDGRHDGGRAGLPPFVPARYRAPILRAAGSWNVPAELLAAQLHAESGFDADARSSAGALGIAQFMPDTARAYGLTNPFDPVASIDAQAHLMHDLLAKFGRVELALAAYNAGPGAVQRFGGVPPYGETQAYVARIVGMLNGSLASLQTPGFGLTASVTGVRLVR